MNKFYGMILCLITFALQGLAVEGEFNIYVRNNSQGKTVTVRLQKTQGYVWSWNDAVVLVSSFNIPYTTSFADKVFYMDAPKSPGVGDILPWGLIKIEITINGVLTRTFFLDTRDERWSTDIIAYPNHDTNLNIDVDANSFYLEMGLGSGYYYAIIDNNEVGIWELWESPGQRNKSNFRIPVTLKNKVENTSYEFGYLVANSQQVNSGNDAFMRPIENSTVSHGTVQTTYQNKNHYSYIWTYENITSSVLYQTNTTFSPTDVQNTKGVTRNFRAISSLTIKNNLIEAGSISADYIEFKDPTTDNQFHPYSASGSGFIKNEAFENLDIEVNGQQHQQYAAKAKNSINYNGVTYLYTGGDFNTTGTDVYLTQPTTLTANYKGSLASNTSTAMASSSQRKIVRTPVKPGLPNGTLHLVYVSAGYVWYETSADNGVTWQIMNNGQPLSGYGGNLPSISWNAIDANGAQAVLITYQQGEQLVIKCFRTTSSGTTFNYLGSISPALTAGSSTDKNPVISLNKNFSGGLMILLVWEEKIWAQLQIPPSLHYWLGQLTTSWPEFQSLTALSEGMISGTSASSTRPTLAGSNGYDFHLAWQEGNSSIKYKKILNTNPPNQQTIKNVSSGDGNIYVQNPSIIAVTSTNTARLSYVGTNGSMYKTTFRDPDNPYSYWKFGSYVMGTNTAINYNDNGYIVAWTQMSDYTYYTRSSTLGGVIRPFLISGGTMFGRDIQVIPGNSFSDMYGAALSVQTNPYRIKRSDNIQTLGKSETVAETFKGREGVVVKDDAQFYFAFGDISVDGKKIDFEEKPDSVQMEGLKTLNKYLTTKPFVLSDKSDFSYDVEYGFVDSNRCLAALKGRGEVNFKVQLIDAKKGNVIGEYDNVRFNRSDVFQHNNIGYNVNTQGIGNKTVQLRLVVATTLDAKYSLGQWFSTTPVTGLEKNTADQTSINFAGIAPVTEYALSQNYPNPFNPATTIDYQIPKDGIVVLKIYDMLGREVRTLVNEYKSVGRYSVVFDAGALASGMYIYRLVSQPAEGGAKDAFTSVKKMMLIK